MDYGRFMQAFEAESIGQVEQTRKQILSGALKGERVPEEVAERIALHDLWAGE